MKRSLITMALMAAGLTLGGCYDDGYGRYGYGGVYSAGAYPYGYGYGGYDLYDRPYYRGRAYGPAPRPRWDDRGRNWRGDRDGRRNDGERAGRRDRNGADMPAIPRQEWRGRGNGDGAGRMGGEGRRGGWRR